MNTLSLRLPSLLLVAVLATFAASCGKKTPTTPSGTTSFSTNAGWTCASGTDCQDVFDITVTAGSVLTIRVTNVSDGSVSQLALYGPGVALGGTNLLTGSTKESFCRAGTGCSDFTGGEQALNVLAAAAGTYRVAVTRNWGKSCGSSGTYKLDVTSTVAFVVVGQTISDQKTLASGAECKV